MIGGTLTEGVLSTGDELEIRPGYKLESEGTTRWVPILTKTSMVFAGKDPVDKATPGDCLL